MLVRSLSCHTVPSVSEMSMLSTNVRLQSHVAAKPMQRLVACRTGDTVQSLNTLTCIFLLLPCNRPGICPVHLSLLQVNFLLLVSCQLRPPNLSSVADLVPCVSLWNWRNTGGKSRDRTKVSSASLQLLP